MAETPDDLTKATNASLTRPDQDLRQEGPDYPPGHREHVPIGEAGTHAAPGYGAAPGRSLDPDADPAAPVGHGGLPAVTGRTVANDLDEGARPASGNSGPGGNGGGAGGDEGGWIGTPNDLAPGALTTNPDSRAEGLAPGAMTTNANARMAGGRIEGDPNHVDAGDPSGVTFPDDPHADVADPLPADARTVRGARVDREDGESVPHARTRTTPPPDLTRGQSPQIQNEPQSPMPAQHQGKPGLESELNPRPRYLAPLYKAAGKLTDKVALITGGDSGIGRAVACLYAREGAHVAIVFLESELTDAQETQRAVEAHGRRCVLIPGDLTDPRFCRAAVEQTRRQLGGIDILVSNAAHQNRKADIADVTEDEFDTTFKTNVYAYFHLAQAAVPHMKPGSAIIATGSEAGIKASKELPDYSASKGAIHALTKALAQQLVKKGIRVNAVAPGPVWTPLNVADQGMTPEKVSEFGAKTPIGRPAQPEEIAPAYVFLASDADSSYITGIVLAEAGGTTTAG